MPATLITYTQSPLETMYVAYRTCYSKFSPEELWNKAIGFPAGEEIESFLAEMFKTKHNSPQRHVNFTFAISGVSRALSHQLVRHVVGVSHSQQSQRYVDGKNFTCVSPPSTTKSTYANADYQMALREANETYKRLQEFNIENEDARFILPNATSTNLVTTFSYEALRNFCHKRLCTQAQWEIRQLAVEMKQEVKKVSPFLAKYLVSQCQELADGMCTESINKNKECWKKRPHKEDLLKQWHHPKLEPAMDYPMEGC